MNAADKEAARVSVGELSALVDEFVATAHPAAIVAHLDLLKLRPDSGYPDPVDAAASLLCEMVTRSLYGDDGVTPADADVTPAPVTPAVTRVCPGCGQAFAPGRPDQVACSGRCRVRLHRQRGAQR